MSDRTANAVSNGGARSRWRFAIATGIALLALWSRKREEEPGGTESVLFRARRFILWVFESWKRLLSVALAIILGFVAAGLLVAWSGAYNIAASKPHWAVTELMLRFGMTNSVEARAPSTRLAEPLDEDAVRLGAGHFHAGCTFCHGAPGLPPSPAAQRMMPRPPDLKKQAPLWKDGELFWIVRHGLKYAGMPAWPSQGRDDEVWAIVAFLRRLPALDIPGYAALALGEAQPGNPVSVELTQESSKTRAIETCVRCHGANAPPLSLMVPTIHGKERANISTALRAYREGQRDSGIMQTAASGLTDNQIERLATYYSGLPPQLRPQTLDPEARVRGEKLARAGIPSRGIPSCLSCHGDKARLEYPRLAGQPRRYLAGQLAAWRSGLNDRSPTGRIMAPIARELTAAEAEDLATYFAALPPERRGEARP